MWLPFIYAAVLVLVFGGYLYLCEREAVAGHRFFLASLRSRLDSGLTKVTNAVERFIRYVVRYIITLSWYYSLHAFLKVTMKSLAGAYHVLESMLIRNRDRARALRKERKQASVNHLTHIADHKAETKLSPAAERKLKDKAMRGD
jgi:hypothetical protein